jgi:hypothetical protein
MFGAWQVVGTGGVLRPPLFLTRAAFRVKLPRGLGIAPPPSRQAKPDRYSLSANAVGTDAPRQPTIDELRARFVSGNVGGTLRGCLVLR